MHQPLGRSHWIGQEKMRFSKEWRVALLVVSGTALAATSAARGAVMRMEVLILEY